MRNETEFLGLIVGINEIKIKDDRKALVRDWPTPNNISEVRSFLGLVQFFSRFVKDFSKIAAPITNLMRKNGSIAKWDQSCDAAFKTLKRSLISAPIMPAPDWARPFRCHTDAGQISVGETLKQIGESGQEHVISYFSKRLSAAERTIRPTTASCWVSYIFFSDFAVIWKGQNSKCSQTMKS